MRLFKHYKNKPYKYVGVARHSETLEEMVVYETRYENSGGKVWVRPKTMFFENVTVGGDSVPRFREIPVELKSTTEITDEKIIELWPLILKVFGAHDRAEFQGVLDNRPHRHLVAAYVEGKLAGFKLGCQHDRSTFYSWLGGVDPEFRGVGIATLLMRAQHDWCRAQGFKTIQSRTKNIFREMIVLNLKHGFDIIGSFTDEKGEPKLILEKKL